MRTIVRFGCFTFTGGVALHIVFVVVSKWYPLRQCIIADIGLSSIDLATVQNSHLTFFAQTDFSQSDLFFFFFS